MYRKILIIVDAQNDFITRALGTKEADAAVPNIVDLIKRFCWEEIICTMDTHDDDYFDTLEGKKLPVKHCIKASVGWCMDSRVVIALNNKFNYYEKDTFGFTYDELDNFLLQGHYPSYDVYKNIEERHKRNLHKVKPMPSCPRYYSTRDWEV